MNKPVSGTNVSPRLQTLDFSEDVKRLTEDFVGRDWIFSEIDKWVTRSGEPFFILTGEAGIGKSAVAARLTQIRDDIAAYHFCVAGRNSTIVPGTVLRSIAAQLGKNLDGYGEALANTIKPTYVSIDVKILVRAMNGGRITGAVLENLTLADPQLELESLLTAPLSAMPAPTRPVLIMLDSLDEAFTYNSSVNLVTLLAGLNNLPSWIRIVLTSRLEERVLSYFASVPKHVVAAESQLNRDDLRRYVICRVGKQSIRARLRAAPRPITRRALVHQVSGNGDDGGLADGNFLYTKILLNDVESGTQPLNDLAALPKSLDEIYQRFLLRLAPEWETRYQPLLAILAVAREPLTRAQLLQFGDQSARLIGGQMSDTLVNLAVGVLLQFLDARGEADQERFSLRHQSLRDYLGEPSRSGRFACPPQDGHGAIADYYLEHVASDWGKCDDYGLKHLPIHLIETARVATTHPMYKKRLKDLTDLLSDLGFLEQKTAVIGVDALLTDLQAALGPDREASLRAVLRVLDRESDSLRSWDREQHPNFFAQQFHNRALEMQLADLATAAAKRLRQIGKPYLALNWRLPGESPARVRTLPGYGTYGTRARLAVTPDSRYVLADSCDQDLNHNLRVWDIETGRELRKLAGNWNPIGFTSDGSQAILASFASLIFWDWRTGNTVGRLHGGDAWLQALVVMPNGRSVICCSHDHHLRQVNLDTGEVMQKFGGPAREVGRLVVTPDGRFAITAAAPDWSVEAGAESEGNNQLLQMWNLETAQEVHGLPFESLMANHLAIRDMAVTPDGRQVIVAFYDHAVKVWDSQTWQEVYSFEGDNILQALTTTPDSHYVIVSSGEEPGNLRIWDLHTGQPVAAFVGNSYPISDVAITPSGRYVISTASDEGALRVWDLQVILAGHREISQSDQIGRVWLRAMTPDGHLAILTTDDSELRVWDIRANKEVYVLGKQDGLVRAVAVTSDSRYAVSAAEGMTPRVWDLQTGKVVHPLASEDRFVRALAVTSDDRYVVAVSGGILRVWNLRTGEVVGNPSLITGDGNPWENEICWAVTITPDSRRVVSATNNAIRIWDFETHKALHTILHQAYAPILAVTPDGRHVFSASDDGTIGVWDLERGEPAHQLTGHKDWVRAIAVTSDGHFAISASNDSTLKVWDLHSWRELRSLNGHKDWVYDMALTKDGRHVFSASQDRTLRVWDWRTGKTVAITTLSGILGTLMVAPDGQTVAVQDRSGSVYCLRYTEQNI